MKSSLNFFFIAIACSFINAKSLSGLKTLSVTGETLPSSSAMTTTASVSHEIKYYTTYVNGETTVLPNNVRAVTSCIPSKVFRTGVEEYCYSTKSLGSTCKSFTTTLTYSNTYCYLTTEVLTTTLPIITSPCKTFTEKCEVITKTVPDTITPNGDSKTITDNPSKSYIYTKCEDVLIDTIQCVYLGSKTITSKGLSTKLVPTITTKTTTTTTTITTYSTQESTIDNTISASPKSTDIGTVSIPKEKTTLSTDELEYYTTTIGKLKVTTVLPVTITIKEDSVKCVSADTGNDCSGERVTLSSAVSVTTKLCTNSITMCKTLTKSYEQPVTTNDIWYVKELPPSNGQTKSMKILGDPNNMIFGGSKTVPGKSISKSETASVITSLDCGYVSNIEKCVYRDETFSTSESEPIATLTETIEEIPSMPITEVSTITPSPKSITTTDTTITTITMTIKRDKSSATPKNDSNCAGKWAQCGGPGFKGPKCCKAGLACRKINDKLSYCY